MDSEKKLVVQNEACVKRASCYHKNEDGKNIVIGCVTEGGQAEIETVVIRDGDTVDEGFILRGTENLYQVSHRKKISYANYYLNEYNLTY